MTTKRKREEGGNMEVSVILWTLKKGDRLGLGSSTQRIGKLYKSSALDLDTPQ